MSFTPFKPFSLFSSFSGLFVLASSTSRMISLPPARSFHFSQDPRARRGRAASPVEGSPQSPPSSSFSVQTSCPGLTDCEGTRDGRWRRPEGSFLSAGTFLGCFGSLSSEQDCERRGRLRFLKELAAARVRPQVLHEDRGSGHVLPRVFPATCVEAECLRLDWHNLLPGRNLRKTRRVRQRHHSNNAGRARQSECVRIVS